MREKRKDREENGRKGEKCKGGMKKKERRQERGKAG